MNFTFQSGVQKLKEYMNILKYTGFNPEQHKAKIEIIAGFTTFITMCYILAINPAILGESGMDKGAVFTATAITTAFATILMGLLGRLPFAQAPGMGLNSYFTYTIVEQLGYSWQTALTITFIVGILYTLIVVFNIQKYILKAIPINLRYSISVGVGLFIAFIGLRNAGIIVDSPSTLVEMGYASNKSIIAFLGIILSGFFLFKKIKGGLFISIIICTIVGIPFGITQIPDNFSVISLPSSVKSTFCAFDFSNILDTDILIVILTVLFICLLDTMGTLLGLASKTGKTDANGEIERMRGALLSDSIATTFGAMIGCSAVTTFTESASGIAEGGKSGLTSIVTGVLFLLALFFSNILLIIPLEATTGSLVIVGVLMISEINKIEMKDITEALPSFITIISIPLTYSIGGGIMLGILTYAFIKIVTFKIKEVNIAMYVIATLILIKFYLDSIDAGYINAL